MPRTDLRKREGEDPELGDWGDGEGLRRPLALVSQKKSGVREKWLIQDDTGTERFKSPSPSPSPTTTGFITPFGSRIAEITK